MAWTGTRGRWEGCWCQKRKSWASAPSLHGMRGRSWERTHNEEEEEAKHEDANAISSSSSSVVKGAVAYEMYSTLSAEDESGNGREKMCSIPNTVGEDDDDEEEEEEEEEEVVVEALRLLVSWDTPFALSSRPPCSELERDAFEEEEWEAHEAVLLLLLFFGSSLRDSSRRRRMVTSPSITLLNTSSSVTLNIHEKLKNTCGERRGVASK